MTGETLRARLEAIRERAVCRYPAVACDRESLTYHQLCAGCADYSDAVAALAKVEVIEKRLRAVAEHSACYFSRTGNHDLCERSDAAYCDECAVRWDMERALADLVPDPQPSSRPAEATPLPDAEGKP